ncbi:DUF1015 domain-containing protein [candidate division KSB1 bacterium]|nr:DUF1015 domain-containing protein [candidate division KSB1 bacterium]
MIAPFKALRYQSTKVGDLTAVVTQPYDKIEAELQADYYRRSPLNVVRIIRSEESLADPETAYPQAAATFQEWLRSGVLAEDGEPALYIYYQLFRFEGREFTRKGFIASVKLEEEGVRAHEHTLAGPKADRLRLLKAIETSDELTFMLFSDAHHEAVRVMDDAVSKLAPIIDVKDDYGETHKVWAVSDKAVIAKLQALVEPRELLIADGHHRYETAINFKHECEAKGWHPVGAQGYDHRMMALFPMEDPGLVIFPTHRLVKNVEHFSGEKLLKALEKHFDVAPHSDEAELYHKIDDARRGQYIIGLKAVGTPWPLYSLRLWNDSTLERELPKTMSKASKRLDVTILHSLILERHLGIDQQKLEAFTHVEYVRQRDEALAQVGEHGIQAAFLLRPTTVSQVEEVSAAGERMPQKSTDFYPKLLAGLVMMKLGIQK